MPLSSCEVELILPGYCLQWRYTMNMRWSQSNLALVLLVTCIVSVNANNNEDVREKAGRRFDLLVPKTSAGDTPVNVPMDLALNKSVGLPLDVKKNPVGTTPIPSPSKRVQSAREICVEDMGFKKGWKPMALIFTSAAIGCGFGIKQGGGMAGCIVGGMTGFFLGGGVTEFVRGGLCSGK